MTPEEDLVILTALHKEIQYSMSNQMGAEKCLSNLFWIDKNFGRDFNAFGKVLAFDTTYITNYCKGESLLCNLCFWVSTTFR